MKRTIKRSRIIASGEMMDASMVGWKFARLGEMKSRNLPVPDFFCLTKTFYEEVFSGFKHNTQAILASIDFNDMKSILEGSEKIRQQFICYEFTEKQKKEILQCFDSMFSDDVLVSVRSSTVGIRLEESEDSADNPFAGMSDSFLYVRRDQVLDKIKLCWASGFNSESLIYRKKQGFNLLGFGVAVGVQRMVAGERSFVLFTCNPNNLSKDAVLAAGYGIGEGIVQEKVPVDHYFRNYNTGEIRREIAVKNNMLTFDTNKGYGLELRSVDESLREKPCLTDEEITEIAQIGEKIEKIFMAPQDIEGTITKDGKIHILQSRPIAIDFRRLRVWANTNVTESFPGVTTALTYSFAKFFYRVIFYDCYREYSVSERVLNDNYLMIDSMIGFIKGRVYYSLTAFYHLHSLCSLFPVVKKSWEKMMAFPSSYQTKPMTGTQVFMEKLRLVHGVLSLVYRYFVNERDVKRFFKWWNGIIEPIRGKSYGKTDPIVALEEFRRVWSEVGNHWAITLINDTLLPLFYGIVENLFKKWKLDGKILLSDLLCGDENLMSVEIIMSAIRLAEYVRNHPELSNVFSNKDYMEIWKDFEEGKLDEEFCSRVRKHLYIYGDRGLQELKMEQPNLRHTPWILLKMIQDYARTDITAEQIKSSEKELRRKADDKLAEELKRHPFRYLLLRKMLKDMRTYIRNRENSRYCRSELYGFSKNIFMGIGEYFASQGILDSKEDIVHLHMHEIFGYIDGTGVTENLRALVEIRKKEYEENQKYETPPQFATFGPIRENVLTLNKNTGSGQNVLRGIGSSSGKVRGIAKIMLSPDASEELGGDVILVARETDPGWLFIMLASKGIVVERGSMLSHTAITGRKFGIPTVVSVPMATSLIPDGAEIEIDGTSGTVTILNTGREKKEKVS